MMVEDNTDTWGQIDALVDFDQYNKETSQALEEQHVNIEFKNQEHMPKKESDLFKPKQKKVQKKTVVKNKTPQVFEKIEESPEEKKILAEEAKKLAVPNDKAPRALGSDEKIGYETVQRSSPDFALAQARKKLAKMKAENKALQMAKL